MLLVPVMDLPHSRFLKFLPPHAPRQVLNFPLGPMVSCVGHFDAVCGPDSQLLGELMSVRGCLVEFVESCRTPSGAKPDTMVRQDKIGIENQKHGLTGLDRA
jgi:hypothetical protein